MDMSLIEFLKSRPWEDFLYLPTIYDHDYGNDSRRNEMDHPSVGHRWISYIRPWQRVAELQRKKSEVQMDKDGFHIAVDVQQFAPNEINVKTVGNEVVVEGKHLEKEDEHGYIARHFVRRYQIPDGVDAEAVISNLSSDGVLTVSAASVPKVQAAEDENVRTLPIKTTGLPLVKMLNDFFANH